MEQVFVTVVGSLCAVALCGVMIRVGQIIRFRDYSVSGFAWPFGVLGVIFLALAAHNWWHGNFFDDVEANLIGVGSGTLMVAVSLYLLRYYD
ncbi:MAG: hypothetical protein AAGF49_06120 [Pseudomonadota bacterium]